MTSSFLNWDYAVIAIYMLLVIGIGFYFSREKQTTSNYLLGNRGMGSVVIGIAIMMALFSSISLVTVPGEIFKNSMTMFMVSTGATLIFTIPAYLIFTRFYFKLGSFTPYEYLEYRYDSKIRCLVAVSAFYGRVMYLAMVIYSTSKIFEGAYGWSPWITILLAGGVSMLSAFLGGSKAVVWVDVIQFFICMGSFLTVMFTLCKNIDGGAVSAVAVAFENGHGLPDFAEAEFYGISAYFRLLFIMLLWGGITNVFVTACSDQITIQRLLSTKDWKAGLKSQIISTILGTVVTLILWFLGLALYTYYHQHPELALQGDPTGDKVFFHYVSKNLPTPLMGLFIAAMLSAVMSTVSSGLNSMSAIWLKEFHCKYINKAMDAAKEVNIAKLATLIIGIIACGLAIALEYAGKWLEQSMAEVGTLFYFFGAMVLPAYLFAVFSKRANSKLIWVFTIFNFGEIMVMNYWYASSRAARLAWEADKSYIWQGGWADKLSIWFPLALLGIAAVFIIPYFIKKWNKILRYVSGAVSMVFCGAFVAALIWLIYSHIYITDEPLARSFLFGPPTTIILSFIALFFCPVQPKEKYQGLTLSTINEPILANRNTEK